MEQSAEAARVSNELRHTLAEKESLNAENGPSKCPAHGCGSTHDSTHPPIDNF